MKHLCLEPEGWPCPLSECPPGLFVFNNIVGFKSEYGRVDEDRRYSDVFCADSGEYFWGGESNKEAREALVVQPVKAHWVDVEM
jgi:hypothetical protein